MSAALVVRLDQSGTVLWARSHGSRWHNQFDHVEVGSDGSIWVAGLAANGLHPTLPRRPDLTGAGDDERPILGRLDENGSIRWVADQALPVRDLLYTPNGLLAATSSGDVLRFKAGREGAPDQVHDLALPTEEPAGVAIGASGLGQLRLSMSGLWQLRSVRLADHWEAIVDRWSWGREAPVSTSLGRVHSGSAFNFRLAIGEGDLMAMTSRRTRTNGSAVWYRVARTGGVVWQHDVSLGPFRKDDYSLEAAHLAVQRGRVLTLFTYGKTAELHGVALTGGGANSGGFVQGASVLQLDLANGNAVQVDTIADPCVAASLSGPGVSYQGFGAAPNRLVVPGDSRGCDSVRSVAFELLPAQ